MGLRDNVDTGGSSYRSAGSGVGNILKNLTKPTARKTVKPSTPARTAPARSTGGYSYNTGMGSSRNGGGYSPSTRYTAPSSGGGRTSIGSLTAPSINSYLGTDAAYQQAVSGSKRSLADFISELGRRRGEATTSFNQTSASMEKDRVRQLDDLRQEFASRGLLQSGLFGEEQGRFQQQFADQMTALKQQQTALLADLLSQEKNYKRENDLTNQQAKQEALARRAAKYGIQ